MYILHTERAQSTSAAFPSCRGQYHLGERILQIAGQRINAEFNINSIPIPALRAFRQVLGVAVRARAKIGGDAVESPRKLVESAQEVLSVGAAGGKRGGRADGIRDRKIYQKR
jgi:hypothetical protein